METQIRGRTETSSILQTSHEESHAYFQDVDLFCLFWDHFCRFAYIIRPGDHFLRPYIAT